MKRKPYRLLAELTYPDAEGVERTVPAGSVVEDLPKSSVEWLVEQGHVEAVQPEPEK